MLTRWHEHGHEPPHVRVLVISVLPAARRCGLMWAVVCASRVAHTFCYTRVCVVFFGPPFPLITHATGSTRERSQLWRGVARPCHRAHAHGQHAAVRSRQPHPRRGVGGRAAGCDGRGAAWRRRRPAEQLVLELFAALSICTSIPLGRSPRTEGSRRVPRPLLTIYSSTSVRTLAHIWDPKYQTAGG